MTRTAIRVQNLGKLYFVERPWQGISTSEASRLPLASADAFAGSRRTTLSQAVLGSQSAKEGFWALRDVSFAVEQGDAVAVLGSNGSGKTTLLRILSRITCPTDGCAEIQGKVGTLLEIGAGLHGDLSGRENIYLNAAIKGMTRIEAERKFHDIAEFAELLDFLDVPLKHYSAGMCARLAFAVAVHLDAEILLVDEVFTAVDQQFQNKCQGKLCALLREGRSGLFVSHDLDCLRRLCNRGIVLSKGRMVFGGPASEAADFYISNSEMQSSAEIADDTLTRI